MKKNYIVSKSGNILIHEGYVTKQEAEDMKTRYKLAGHKKVVAIKDIEPIDEKFKLLIKENEL
tara:strand:+ start:1974 stop:2162 length:189 start_codon:yes stop_codon:yes gene_type:complete